SSRHPYALGWLGPGDALVDVAAEVPHHRVEAVAGPEGAAEGVRGGEVQRGVPVAALARPGEGSIEQRRAGARASSTVEHGGVAEVGGALRDEERAARAGPNGDDADGPPAVCPVRGDEQRVRVAL